MILLLAGLGVWWLQRPSYLKIHIPVKPNPVGYFWWQTEYSEHHYLDEPGTLYVFRQAGDGYTDSQGWKTTAEAMGFFDDWLRRHGWQEKENTPGDAWHVSFVPESYSLRGHTEFRLYVRPGDRYGDGDQVAVAIQPIPNSQGFRVTLVTARPSWLMSLAESFDNA